MTHIDFRALRAIARGNPQQLPFKLPVWIEVPRVPVSYREMLAHVGRRCEDYEQLCPVCKAYEEWDATGTITCLVERKELIAP